MKRTKWGTAALLLSLFSLMGTDARAQQTSNDFDSVDFASDLHEAELAQYSVASGGIGFASRGGAAMMSGVSGAMSRPIQIVAGAEYIYARASFSQALAYVEQNSVTATENFVQYDFDYNSSYGFYGGVYLCDCGGSIMFNYTRLQSDAAVAAAPIQGQTAIFGPYEIDGIIRGYADVDLKSYDLSFAKTIPLGCPLQGGCCGCGDGCDTCCDDCCGDGCNGCCNSGCGCCACPAWDITWSGGVRFAEVAWGRGLTSFDPLATNTVLASADTSYNFEGFGGRVGLEGRRYIGKRGLVSLYAKGDFSVLLGDIDVSTRVFDANAVAEAFAVTSCRHIVPVTEIELGGTVHIGCHANITAGYFFAAWHDLGFRDEYDFTQFQTSHYDDANILGFDGFFARAEVMF
jgi:hypothetical protein